MASASSHTSPFALITTEPGCSPLTTCVSILSSAPNSNTAAAAVRIFVVDAGRNASPANRSNSTSPVEPSDTRAWNVPNAGSSASSARRACSAWTSTGRGTAGTNTGSACGN